MNTTTFDTLTVARRLKAAGVEEKQAEVIAETMYETIVASRERLLTKTDLAAVKIDLDAFDIGIKAELTAAVNRFIFTMLVAMGVLFAALKLF